MTEHASQFVNTRSYDLIVNLCNNFNTMTELKRICKLSPSYDMFYIKGLDHIGKTDEELLEEIKQCEILNCMLMAELQKIN